MKLLAWIAAGGAAGAVARYLVMVAVGALAGGGFPWGTLAVNVAGSFLLGVLAEGLALAWTLSAEIRAMLVVGVLGAFTTFSTFSLDVVTLYERGALVPLAAYVAASLALSVAGLFAGLAVTRAVLG